MKTERIRELADQIYAAAKALKVEAFADASRSEEVLEIGDAAHHFMADVGRIHALSSRLEQKQKNELREALSEGSDL